MGDWEHKQGNWSIQLQTNKDGEIVGVRKAVDMYKKNSEMVKLPNYKSFQDWLDWHCEGGWEVFNIYYKDSSRFSEKLCIFRRRK